MNASEHPPQHSRCVCGDRNPCSCTPSPGFHPPEWWPATHADLRLVHAAITALGNALGTELAAVRAAVEKTLRKVTHVSVSVDKLLSDVQALVDGGKAKDLLIAQLQAELANADATAQARVDAAVAAEDSDAQAKIDAADAVAAEYLNPPADGGGEPAPEPAPEG